MGFRWKSRGRPRARALCVRGHARPWPGPGGGRDVHRAGRGGVPGGASIGRACTPPLPRARDWPGDGATAPRGPGLGIPAENQGPSPRAGFTRSWPPRPLTRARGHAGCPSAGVGRRSGRRVHRAGVHTVAAPGDESFAANGATAPGDPGLLIPGTQGPSPGAGVTRPWPLRSLARARGRAPARSLTVPGRQRRGPPTQHWPGGGLRHRLPRDQETGVGSRRGRLRTQSTESFLA